MGAKSENFCSGEQVLAGDNVLLNSYLAMERQSQRVVLFGVLRE